MIELHRTEHFIEPDQTRLVARSFVPGGVNFAGSLDRLARICARVLDIDPAIQKDLLNETKERVRDRYLDIEATWRRHFDMAAAHVESLRAITDDGLKLLVGAYVTQGYAYEGAALTNPSMVPFGAAKGGSQPFVMSARAIGEGHISSIAFLTGTVSVNGEVAIDPRSLFAGNGDRRTPLYDRAIFLAKLLELGLANEASDWILGDLPIRFSTEQLDQSLERALHRDLDPILLAETVKRIHWLAASNYWLDFDHSSPISERLISPAAPAESGGMEDARFVRFVDEGSTTYYATYTAYDGTNILPQLIETQDFVSFRMATLSGPTAYHKGMAIFPRKIDGAYAALSRHDHETTFIMRSDNIRRWSNAEAVLRPEAAWEAVHTGNCGSPIETEEGWLVITHGVGPMRRYVLGAVLLDLNEPAKVLARLRSPLVEPEPGESFGYVPDVVYSCGSMLHERMLILPYGVADRAIRIVTVPFDSLIDHME